MKDRIFVIAAANLTASEIKMLRWLITRIWRNNMLTNARSIIVFSILVSTSGCSFFSSTTGDELIFAATEVGSPVGEKVTKDIGPAGGTLSSTDGRLTLTVPPNAVTKNVSFSIQPISNNVEDGVGLAYRLEPHGKAFNAPLLISISFSDSDFEGTLPQELKVGYQDEKGAWHVPTSNKVDMASRRVDVTTNHLSDWSLFMLALYRIIPSKADLRVGESVVISVRRCSLGHYSDWIFFGDKKVCKEIGSSSDNQRAWKLKGPGTLKGEKWPRVIYTAPAKQPKPNVVTVTYDAIGMELEAKIRIIGRGYRVSGSGDWLVTFSGTICSLENPFTVYGSAYNYNLKFTPSSDSFTPSTDSKGTWTLDTFIEEGKVTGGGTYTIENLDSDKPRIKVMGDSTVTVPYHPPIRTGSGTFYLDLTPLDTDECGEPTPDPPARGWGPPELKGKGPF